MFVLFALLFFVGAFLFSLEFKEYRKGEKTYEEARQYAVKRRVPAEEKKENPEKKREEGTTSTEAGEDQTLPEVDFAGLKERAPDVMGWLTIPGTNIDYPVVQGQDNIRYLTRLYDGTPNKSGALFLDARNQEDLSNPTNIIYGHNLVDGAMFSELNKYTEKEFFLKHEIGYITLPKSQYKIRFFTIFFHNPKFEGPDSPWRVSFDNREEWESWLDKMKSMSVLGEGIKDIDIEKVLVLSTCTDNARDRILLLGSLEKMN